MIRRLKMLFMIIYTWEPGQRDALIKRRIEKKGSSLAEGVQKIHEWFDAGGGRGFVVFETNDPRVIMTSIMTWDDLLKAEVVSLLDVTEIFPKEKNENE
jgi:hypothetical protein